MHTRGQDLPPPRFLQIKQDDKFFSRLLSKESSKREEASFRVLYYGGNSGSIPFMWESQPGTPKHTFSDNSLPPLTPPPSYQLSTPRMKTMQKRSKPNFFNSIFPRASSKKSAGKSASFSPPSSLAYSSSSPHSSSCSLPSTPKHTSAIHFGLDEDDDPDHMPTSPTSTLCFGAGIKCSGQSGSGHHPMKNVMKKAFLSIVGHGTRA
nr:uncharacterized protein LOC113725301 [Coffea arabica]